MWSKGACVVLIHPGRTVSVLLPEETLPGPAGRCVPGLTQSQPWLGLEKGISTVVFPGSFSMFGHREAGCEYSPETRGSAEAGSNHRVAEDSLAGFESDTARASHWPESLCSLAGSEQ